MANRLSWSYHAPAAVSHIHHHVHLRGPDVDLPLPEGEGGQGYHQQKEQVEEGDGLDGLCKALLISFLFLFY